MLLLVNNFAALSFGIAEDCCSLLFLLTAETLILQTLPLLSCAPGKTGAQLSHIQLLAPRRFTPLDPDRVVVAELLMRIESPLQLSKLVHPPGIAV